jgi:flagellar biosynthetic protein FliR
MNVLLNLAWSDILTFLFVFLRVGVIFATVPFFSAEIIPRRMTATIAFFLSLILLPVIPPLKVDVAQVGMLYLLLVMLHEIFLGISLGLAVTVIFAAVQLAGELIGFQMGFAIVNVIDPMTGIDAPITSNFLYIIAFLLFLSLDGHFMLIKAMHESFTLVPIGTGLPQQGFFYAALRYAAGMFSLALQLSAPVIGVLLLINIAFALISRAIPQMNIFIMSFPIIIALGLVFMMITIRLMPFFLEGRLREAWGFMQAVMKLF